MSKEERKKIISAIYKILLLFEDVADSKTRITEQDYLKYLERLSIRFTGREDEEIVDIINGLIKLGTNLSKQSVKSVVFHMINIIEKRDE